MDANEIATKQDIMLLEKSIKFEIQKLVQNKSTGSAEPQGKYLRSRDVRKLLSISQNKLQEMRLKGQIPFVQIGATFFYPEKELNEAFKLK